MRGYTIIFLLLLSLSTKSQNLLDTSSWKIGNEKVKGFHNNGKASENSRVLGVNHVGQRVVLWKASNDSTSDADGGWNTEYYKANNNTTYRFSVWLKKTNSNDGHSYFGFNANNKSSLDLKGKYDGNPYFWHGDLPKLNRWYLVVGYVHKSSYSGKTNIGGIYDGVTGEKVKSTKDFKFKKTMTKIRHRSYLYYDTNTDDSQYLWNPRMESVNGNEPSIKELLNIKENSVLVFSYDLAGNQKQYSYCSDRKSCGLSENNISERKAQSENIVVELDKSNRIEDEFKNDNSSKKLEKTIDIDLFPNPTSDFISIRISDISISEINSMRIYNISSSFVKKVNLPEGSNTSTIDLSGLPSGIYFLQIHLKDNRFISKKIIKE